MKKFSTCGENISFNPKFLAMAESFSSLNPYHKIVVLGEAQVGKSAYIKRIRSSEFSKSYQPTLGVQLIKTEVSRLVYRALEESSTPEELDIVNFAFWDIGSKLRGLTDEECWAKAEGFLIIVDSKSKIAGVINLITRIRGYSKTVPIIIAFNKVDKHFRGSRKFKNLAKTEGVPFYLMSVASCFQIYKPLEYFQSKFVVEK